MIQEYDKKFDVAVTKLGRLVQSTYDVRNLGEFEKILVYTKGEDVIGFVQYQKLYETVDILYIAVDKHYRGLGIGTELIERIASDLDVEKIILEVRVSNEKALAFYERLGFKRVRPIANYYRDGEDALSMEKVV